MIISSGSLRGNRRRGNRRNNLCVMFLLGAFSIFSGCASGGPAVDRGKGSEKSDYRNKFEQAYPQAEFITAWGIGSESERDAEQDARARVAEQIRSKIRSVMVSLEEATMRDQKIRDYQILTSEISTIAEFSHNELIVIDKASSHKKNGLYYVFAHISRRNLTSILSAEYGDNAVKFRSRYSGLNPSRNNLPSYTSALRAMRDLFRSMAEIAFEIRAVSGRAYEPFQQDNESMRMIEAARLKLLGSLYIAVKVVEMDGVDSEKISESVRAALSSLGVGTVGTECSPEGCLMLLIPRITWKKVVGDICELTITGDLRFCDGDIMLTEISLSGSGLRGSGRNPLDNLTKSITPEVLAPLLYSSLGHVVPLTAPNEGNR